jgi:hypothetical protein
MAGSYHSVVALWRAKEGECCSVKRYWEIVADNLSKAGWSWGCVSAIDANGQTIWIADAHRGDGQRFVVRADETLTAFAELERRSDRPAERDESLGLKPLRRFGSAAAL